MATNPYFNNGNTSYTGTGEQDLLDTLTIETIQIHGHDMVYCPRTLVNTDDIFGEDVLSAFNKKFEIEMYIDTAMQFEGDGDFFGKFGLQISDSADLVVSQARFKEITGEDHPNEGDLVYFPLTRTLLEIKFVEHENPFYNLGKLTTFKLNCELFNYSHEEFNTGDEAIDALNISLGNNDDTVNDAYADNDVYEEEKVGVVNYDEENPFGEY